MALLSIAHLVQKLSDCCRCLGEKEVREAAAQYQVVVKLCEGRPQFNDCYSTIPVEAILVAHDQFKRQSIETTKVEDDVASLVNLVDKMSSLQDLLTLRIPIANSNWGKLRPESRYTILSIILPFG